MFRRFQLIVVVLVLALTAAACGGGDDDTAGATTTSAASSGDGGDATTTTTAAATTTTTTEAVSGDSGSDWCEDLRKAEEEDDEDPLNLDLFNLTPDEIKAQLERAVALFEDWAQDAPPEIDEDVDVLVTFFRRYVDAGNAADWDLLAMIDDPDFAASAEDPALEQAGDRIVAYNRDVCGVEFGTAEPDPGTDDPISIALEAFQLPAGLFSAEDIECMRTEVGSEFEARITPEWVPSAEDIAVLLAAVDSCGISLG